jgi:hypothetical protein
MQCLNDNGSATGRFPARRIMTNRRTSAHPNAAGSQLDLRSGGRPCGGVVVSHNTLELGTLPAIKQALRAARVRALGRPA